MESWNNINTNNLINEDYEMSDEQMKVDDINDVVVDNVASEISISSSIERASGINLSNTSQDSLTLSPSVTKLKKKPIANLNKSKTSHLNQDSILMSNQANLTQFITTMRPPLIQGANVKVLPVNSSSNSSNSTNKGLMKKPLAPIAPAPSQHTSSPRTPSSSNVTKVILTGQPFIISSPAKAGSDSNQKTVSNQSISNNHVQTGQQLFILSPAKSNLSNNKVIEVRPKPQTIQIPMTKFLQQKTDGKQQLIKIIPVSNSGVTFVATSAASSQSSNIKTLEFNKKPNYTLSPNTKINTEIKNVMVPTSSLKCSSLMPSSVNFLQTGVQNAYLTNTTGASVIMIPSSFMQTQGDQANTNQNKLKTNSGFVKHVTFSNKSLTSTNISGATLSPLSNTTHRTSFVPIAPSPLTTQTIAPSASQILAGLTATRTVQNTNKANGDTTRPRKPCNCTKSQCLKLYCDCFANGEFCHSCNCINCFNNLEHEEDRQKAIKQCLERNPHAFHPKIGKGRGDVTERRHTKGCNCRRSGCLKNYCECYEAKILCSDLCKCITCKNYEDSYERKTLMHLADAAEVRSAQQSAASKTQLWGSDFTAKLPIRLTSDKMERLHCSFITSEVLEATCLCLLATAEDGEKAEVTYEEIEAKIIDEFGSCLSKIIETANNVKKC